MEVVRTKKRVMTSVSVALFSFVLSASILFVHATGISASDPIYKILPDVMPLVAIEPANPPWDGNFTSFRFKDGLLYSGNTIVDGSLGDVLAYMGAASQAYVNQMALTTSDVVSALKQYFSGGASYESFGSDMNLPQQLSDLRSIFGTYPFSYSRRVAGSASNSSVTISNLGQFLSVIGSDLQTDLNLAAGNYYLDSTGKRVVTDVARNLPFLIGNGLSGLRYNLVGVGTKDFISGTGESLSASDVLGGLEAMNTQLVKTLTNQGLWTYLDANGQPSTAQNMTLTNVLQRGLLGLSYNLRGSTTASGIPMQLYDYKTGQYSETVMLESLFDLNATGFEQLQNMFALYMYSHGTDLDIQERDNMQEQAEQFVEDFTSPGGKGTMSKGNMSDMANVSSSMTSNFSSDASVSDIFTQIGNGDNYSFFSNSVLNDLEGSVPSTFSFVDDGYVDFLTPHLEDFGKAVGSSW